MMIIFILKLFKDNLFKYLKYFVNCDNELKLNGNCFVQQFIIKIGTSFIIFHLFLLIFLIVLPKRILNIFLSFPISLNILIIFFIFIFNFWINFDIFFGFNFLYKFFGIIFDLLVNICMIDLFYDWGMKWAEKVDKGKNKYFYLIWIFFIIFFLFFLYYVYKFLFILDDNKLKFYSIILFISFNIILCLLTLFDYFEGSFFSIFGYSTFICIKYNELFIDYFNYNSNENSFILFYFISSIIILFYLLNNSFNLDDNYEKNELIYSKLFILLFLINFISKQLNFEKNNIFLIDNISILLSYFIQITYILIQNFKTFFEKKEEIDPNLITDYYDY